MIIVKSSDQNEPRRGEIIGSFIRNIYHGILYFDAIFVG